MVKLPFPYRHPKAAKVLLALWIGGAIALMFGGRGYVVPWGF